MEGVSQLINITKTAFVMIIPERNVFRLRRPSYHVYPLIHTHMHTCTPQQGFKTFLGIVPVIANWSPKGDEFSLILESNPLTDFVELPEDHPNLLYSNIICGVIRGALEMVRKKAHKLG